MKALRDVIAGNPYPGRGIAVARTAAGAVVCYFVTGRSPASRERRLRVADTGELTVGPIDAADEDPLRHYVAAAALPGWLVVGNGRQVPDVASRLDCGLAPTVAMGDLEHEPDGPIFTDRITAVLSRPGGGQVVFGIARRSAGARGTSNILTLTARELASGDALLLTTYRSDGATINGARPVLEATCDAADAESLLEQVWTALDPAYRVAAAAIAADGAPRDTRIRNEH